MEARRLPPAPFESILVFDDFGGPDGGLIGTRAVSGQLWQPTITPYDDLAVVSHQAFGTTNDQNGAEIVGVLDLAGNTLPWWIRFTALIGAKPSTTKSIGAWVGDDAVGPYFGLAVLYNSTQAVDAPQVLAGQLDASPLTVTVTGLDVTVLHEFVVQWSPVGSVVTLIVDDVVVGTQAGVTPDPATATPFVVSPACGLTAVPAAFGAVEVGVGVYQ